MNDSPFHHALLVLAMVVLMLAGGLIESGRAAVPANASSPAPVAAPVSVSSAVTTCDQAR